MNLFSFVKELSGLLKKWYFSLDVYLHYCDFKDSLKELMKTFYEMLQKGSKHYEYSYVKCIDDVERRY